MSADSYPRNTCGRGLAARRKVQASYWRIGLFMGVRASRPRLARPPVEASRMYFLVISLLTLVQLNCALLPPNRPARWPAFQASPSILRYVVECDGWCRTATPTCQRVASQNPTMRPGPVEAPSPPPAADRSPDIRAHSLCRRDQLFAVLHKVARGPIPETDIRSGV
jgi:hypothetical protein